MFRECGSEGLGIVEKDVDPDPRVRSRDAGHVTQRATCGGERLVSVDPRRARLVQENVRQRMRKVTGQRDEPVVRLRIDRDRHRAQRRDEAVQHPVPLRVGGRIRREEPGRPSKQPPARMRRAVRFRAADRMSADEAGVAHRPRERCLRRADVRYGRPVAARRAPQRLRRQRRHRGGTITSSAPETRSPESGVTASRSTATAVRWIEVPAARDPSLGRVPQAPPRRR
jgi:hypothetical protein